nr:hypothetical protein [Alcaligenes faecalis]
MSDSNALHPEAWLHLGKPFLNQQWSSDEPLVTSAQAEAYAAAKVREALEEAAKVAESCVCSCCCSDDQKFTAQDAAQRIRALIPSTPA